MARARPAPPPEDPGFSIRVSPAGRSGKDSRISVEADLTRLGLPGLVLRSSDRKEPRIPARRWPAGVRWSIEDRLRREGARKGRVLAVWQGDQVVAVCSWHLHESGPAVIFDLACRMDLDDSIAKMAATVLLLCLRRVAEASALRRDTSTLRWADPALDRIPDRDERNRVRHAVRARARAFGFEPLRPRPRWVAKGWVTERRF